MNVITTPFPCSARNLETDLLRGLWLTQTLQSDLALLDVSVSGYRGGVILYYTTTNLATGIDGGFQLG
jgi:hypothetical protein